MAIPYIRNKPELFAFIDVVFSKKDLGRIKNGTATVSVVTPIFTIKSNDNRPSQKDRFRSCLSGIDVSHYSKNFDASCGLKFTVETGDKFLCRFAITCP